MNDCPSPERMKQLLTEELSDEVSNTLAAHIEVCDRCRQTLEQLNAESENEACGLLAKDQPEPITPEEKDFLNRLRQAPPYSPPTEIANYTLVNSKALGRGGQGSVYHYRHKVLPREAAVKLPLDSFLNRRDADKFFEEGCRATELDHPNFVRVYDAGRLTDGTPYIAMDLVAGTRADEAFASASPREIANMIHKVALAIEAAHTRKVLHRDIKPANILVDRYGNPKLVDFGVAWRPGSENDLTQPAGSVGTAGFMAPEVVKGLPYCETADVYSLGATLYHLLTRGQTPVPIDKSWNLNRRVEDWKAYEQRLEDSEPELLRKLDNSIPKPLQDICLKALERDPTLRYPTAAEFANDLDRFLNGRPVHAYPSLYQTRVESRVRSIIKEVEKLGEEGIVSARQVDLLVAAHREMVESESEKAAIPEWVRLLGWQVFLYMGALILVTGPVTLACFSDIWRSFPGGAAGRSSLALFCCAVALLVGARFWIQDKFRKALPFLVVLCLLVGPAAYVCFRPLWGPDVLMSKHTTLRLVDEFEPLGSLFRKPSDKQVPDPLASLVHPGTEYWKVLDWKLRCIDQMGDAIDLRLGDRVLVRSPSGELEAAILQVQKVDQDEHAARLSPLTVTVREVLVWGGMAYRATTPSDPPTPTRSYAAPVADKFDPVFWDKQPQPKEREFDKFEKPALGPASPKTFAEPDTFERTPVPTIPPDGMFQKPTPVPTFVAPPDEREMPSSDAEQIVMAEIQRTLFFRDWWGTVRDFPAAPGTKLDSLVLLCLVMACIAAVSLLIWTRAGVFIWLLAVFGVGVFFVTALLCGWRELEPQQCAATFFPAALILLTCGVVFEYTRFIDVRERTNRARAVYVVGFCLFVIAWLYYAGVGYPAKYFVAWEDFELTLLSLFAGGALALVLAVIADMLDTPALRQLAVGPFVLGGAMCLLPLNSLVGQHFDNKPLAWELALLLNCLALIWLSINCQRKNLLYQGAIYLAISIFQISYTHFSDKWAWPIGLVVLGMLIMTVACRRAESHTPSRGRQDVPGNAVLWGMPSGSRTLIFIVLWLIFSLTLVLAGHPTMRTPPNYEYPVMTTPSG